MLKRFFSVFMPHKAKKDSKYTIYIIWHKCFSPPVPKWVLPPFPKFPTLSPSLNSLTPTPVIANFLAAQQGKMSKPCLLWRPCL